jgi:hypothetical protein
MKRIYQRFGYEMPHAFETHLLKEKNRERNYSSGHRYSLAAFDLDPESVSGIFSDVLENFGYAANKNAAISGA